MNKNFPMTKNIKTLAAAFGCGVKSSLKAHWSIIKASPLQAIAYYGGWCAILGASIHLGMAHSSWLWGLGTYTVLGTVYNIVWYRAMRKLALDVTNDMLTALMPNR